MTLIEKFLPKMYCYFGSGMLTNAYDENVALQNAKECEKIADEVAIEFAEWITVNYPNQRKFLLRKGNLDGFYTTSELLEIFKKEKGL